MDHNLMLPHWLVALQLNSRNSNPLLAPMAQMSRVEKLLLPVLIYKMHRDLVYHLRPIDEFHIVLTDMAKHMPLTSSHWNQAFVKFMATLGQLRLGWPTKSEGWWQSRSFFSEEKWQRSPDAKALVLALKPTPLGRLCLLGAINPYEIYDLPTKERALVQELLPQLPVGMPVGLWFDLTYPERLAFLELWTSHHEPPFSLPLLTASIGSSHTCFRVLKHLFQKLEAHGVVQCAFNSPRVGYEWLPERVEWHKNSMHIQRITKHREALSHFFIWDMLRKPSGAILKMFGLKVPQEDYETCHGFLEELRRVFLSPTALNASWLSFSSPKHAHILPHACLFLEYVLKTHCDKNASYIRNLAHPEWLRMGESVELTSPPIMLRLLSEFCALMQQEPALYKSFMMPELSVLGGGLYQGLAKSKHTTNQYSTSVKLEPLGESSTSFIMGKRTPSEIIKQLKELKKRNQRQYVQVTNQCFETFDQVTKDVILEFKQKLSPELFDQQLHTKLAAILVHNQNAFETYSRSMVGLHS